MSFSVLAATFANNILPILLLGGAGFALGKFLHVDSRSLGRVVFYIFSPVLIFNLLLQNRLNLSEAIGVISPTARITKTTTLITFAAYNTRSTWAWTPVPSWSPDGAFVVTTQHATVNTGEAPEDSPAFDIVATVVPFFL